LQQEPDWRSAAASDLDAARQALLENSPAMHVDRDSAHFRRWLEQGYRLSRSRLSRVTDARSYYYLLKGYVGGFRDVHINAFPQNTFPVQSLPKEWPGFATAWRSGQYVVSSTSDAPGAAVPPVGARLISCDGTAPQALASKRLDRFEWDLQMEMGRFEYAHLLLWDMGNPFAGPRPKSCRFHVRGRSTNYRLRYRAIFPEEAQTAHRASAAKATPPALDISPWGERAWWIGIPHFGDNQDWEGLFTRVDQNLAAIRNSEVVVVDVRGNGGGNSGKASRLAAALWGTDMFLQHFPRLGNLIHRASPRNRAHYERRGPPELLAAFDAAMAAGNAVFEWRPQPFPMPERPPQNPMRARVIVLTDQTCTSACLDMMDLFLSMPRVEQAGIETNGDTIFMDIVQAVLPSGMMRLHYGHKAWHQRPRGSNQTYRPAPELTYAGNIADDAEWKRWLRRRLLLETGSSS
jgi:hypothetical protein